MPVSASAVSFVPTTFIPALVSLRGRSDAADFTSQLEDLKAALGTTPPSDPVRATLAEKSDIGAAIAGSRKRDASRSGSASGPGTKDSSPEEAGAFSTAVQNLVRSLADRGTGQGSALPDETTPVQRPATQPADSPISITRTNQIDSQAPLSFAAKIQAPDSRTDLPQDTQSQQEDPGSAPSFGAVAAALKKAPQNGQASESDASAAGSALNSTGTLNSTINGAAIMSAVQAPAIQPQSAPHDNTQPLAAPKETEILTTSQPQSSAPLKDLSFNIAQPGGSAVQLRMVEHAGELRVAVHTTSPELNQDLRAALPDLTRKLSDTGAHAELWRPDAHSTAASSDAAASQNQTKHGENSANSQSQSGGSQQGRGQRGQHQYRRPKWVEELENGMQPTTKSTGEIYGIRS